MKITKEFAEILGMFAADGCIQHLHYVCMWGNIYEDQEYYDEIVCKLFSQVFNKKVVAHEKKSNSVYGFYICDKEIIKIFKELGFSNNKTYNVKVPEEILNSNDEEIIAAFIRGFTDCDGCLTFMKRKEKGYSEFKRKFNTYPRIFINIVSKNMINDLSYLLKKLKIKHSVHTRKTKKLTEKNQYVITIRGEKRIEKWKDKIGFNNYSKLTKYLIWKRFGFCPTKINLNQRKLILKNELNPHSFYNSN
ncbi:MAG: hypothetical protein KJ646_01410 [Nanoarchaeota archaeon]|nr:hypothetical protein [Nanoarchaeota archaeon]MBU4116820.1 hypothetical protein [Nanoarchaeota archaeon]